MAEVGFEIHRIEDLPDSIRVNFKNKSGFVVKKIFNPEFRIEWEELGDKKPSDWLLEALPSED